MQSQQPSMQVEAFFELFLQELKQNPNLRNYYKFLENKSRFAFRKAYFCQRLQYIADHVKKGGNIWDCGCGFGTTGLFLAMNGIPSRGTTLEFYFKEIPDRMKFWTAHGPAELFKSSYENLFDNPPKLSSENFIIVQDTLHHLEPLSQALKIFADTLKPNGKLVVVEENGSNVIQNLKLFARRGNNRVIEMWDEKLGKNILLGNENIRSLEVWEQALAEQQLELEKEAIQYIRFFPPFSFNGAGTLPVIEREQRIWKKNPALKKYLFFGLNFVATKAHLAGSEITSTQP
jgi:SAM-dependent methyltransferase